MDNNIRIKGGHPISENLSTVVVGGKSTSLEISSDSNGARVMGDLEVTGLLSVSSLTDLSIDDLILDDITCDEIVCGNITTGSLKKLTIGTDMEFTSTGIHARTTDLDLDCGDTDDILIQEDGDTFAKFTIGGIYPQFYIYESAGGTDNLNIAVTTHGATTIQTNDVAGDVGHLNFNADGDIDFKSFGYGATVAESASKSITFNPGTSVIIDKNLSETTASTVTALSIDLDKTGTSTSNNTIYGALIDVDNTTATNGANTMYGIYCTPTLTHAADAGTAIVVGAYINATGSSNGTSSSTGLMIDQAAASTADTNLGLQIRSAANSADYFAIDVTTEGATTITTVDADTAVANLTFDVDGDITLDADGGEIYLKDDGNTFGEFSTAASRPAFILYEDISGGTDRFQVQCREHGYTSIATVDGAGTDADLLISADGDITLSSATGVFILKNNATEFSVANSAYAGMILGYTTIGIDSADASSPVTNTFTVLSDDHKVKFVAPPSGVVEIEVSIYVDATSGSRPLKFGLSDADTTGYSPIDFPNSNDVTNEHEVFTADETDEAYVHHKWVVTGLTPGTAYEWWLGVASSHNFQYVLRWGGNVTAEYAPFIMKATALPTAVADFAVYG